MARTTTWRNCGRSLDQAQNFCGGCGVSVLADADPSDPYVGRLIDGKYLVEQLVGTGAMGVVYRAKQVSLNKRVALKILRRSLLGDATVALRFKQEARAASRLNHPNTIQILDFGELPDVGLYMTMEFVEGQDLGKIIQRELPLPPRRLVRIIKQVLSALDEAHGGGIIHRDIKPANILVCNLRLQPDHVKVLDFGIAKILDPDPAESVPMTRDGFVCGTPAFMSPEQVQGLPLDPRTDLFSLGIVLYQCLTGHLPFEADSAVEMATKIVLEPTPLPSKRRPDWEIPPALEAVVMQALQKQRDRRFRNAGEMLALLEEAERTLPGEADLELSATSSRLASSGLASSGLAAGAPPPGPGRALVGLPFALGPVSSSAPRPRPMGPGLSASGDVPAVIDSTPRVDPGGVPTLQLPTAPPSAAVQTWTNQPPVRRQAEIPTQPELDSIAERQTQSAEIGVVPLPPSRRFKTFVLVIGLLVLGGASVLLGRLVGGWLTARETIPAVAPGSLVPDATSAARAVADGGPPGPPAARPALPPPTVSPGTASPGAGAGPATALPAPGPRRRPAPEVEPAPARPSRPPPSSATQRATSLHEEGMALMRQTDWEGALAKLRQARQLAPGLPVVHRDLGRIAMRLGRDEDAVGHFRRYLELAPRAEEASTYRTIIDNLSRR